MEAHAGDAVRVDHPRFGDRCRPDRDEERQHEDGAALRLLSGHRRHSRRRGRGARGELVPVALSMTPLGSLLIGWTAIVAALVGLLVFAVLRLSEGARSSTRFLSENRSE